MTKRKASRRKDVPTVHDKRAYPPFGSRASFYVAHNTHDVVIKDHPFVLGQKAIKHGKGHDGRNVPKPSRLDLTEKLPLR